MPGPTGHSFRHISLRYFLISTVLPILAIFLALSVYYSRQAFDFNQNVYAGALDAASSALNSSFAELEQISFTPYLYNGIARTMSYMKSGFLEPGVEQPDYLNISRMESEYTILFTKLLHSSQQKVLSIYFYPFGAGYGDCYSINRDTAGLQFSVVDAAEVERLYRDTGIHGSNPVFLCLEPEEEGSARTFSLLRTIKDYDSGKELGILRIDAVTATLCEGLGGLGMTENSYLLLRDGQGAQVYYSGQGSTAKPLAAPGASFADRQYAVQSRSPGASGWTLDLVTSVSDIRVSTADSVFLIFAVTMLAFLSAFWLYRLQSADAVASIDSILCAVRQLQEGNLDYVCRVKGNRDFQMIADALNETGKKLRELIHTEAEARISRSKAEYMALQSQINPHFLYNTLNGFIALNRLGERQLLETSILHLTKLFRYICSNSDTTTVAQEYDFAVQYLELQKLRFEERIEYTVVVDPEVAEDKIPKLVIQPIVENCVVHGMEESDEPIEIILHSYRRRAETGDSLVLEIVDTGVGFDTGKAAPHVGLANVVQRLKFFHPDSQYEVRSAPGRGTTVCILIPLAR